MKPRIFLSVGEPSGDNHAAHLVKALQKKIPSPILFEGLGGPKMKEQGVHIHFELARHPIMGILAVFAHLPMIYKVFTKTLVHLRRTRPDLLILVDNPGFNLQLAKAAKKLGIPVVYYISPQIWAWWSSRINKIPKKVDKMLVILPFEEDLYRKVNLDTEYVGHPTFDDLSSKNFDKNIPSEILEIKKKGKLISILPGSRTKEIAHNFPLMLQTAYLLSQKHSNLFFLIGATNEEKKKQIQHLLQGTFLQPKILVGQTHYLMAHSHLSLVTSGTATLELTYFKTPMVICYRIDPISYFGSKLILSLPYFGLPNILAKKEIVPEHLMYKNDVEKLFHSALPLVENTSKRKQCLKDLEKVYHLLARKKNASKNVALAIAKMLLPKG